MTTAVKILAALAAVLAVAFGVQTCMVARAEDAARSARLAKDSVEAVLDTTRDVTAELVGLIGDSMRAVERRILQVTPDRDAIDRALARNSAAVANLSATVRGLAATIASDSGTAEDTAGVRRATFTVDDPPYAGTARVALPMPPAAGTLDLDLSLAPAALSLRLMCGEAVQGIRPASALVTAPAWLTVTVDSVRQDPDVCNRQEPGVAGWALTTAAGGGLVLSEGELRYGPGVFAGVGRAWDVSRLLGKLWPF